MKKLFTLVALLAMFLGAKAETIVDAEVNFSDYTDISQVPRFSWGGAQQAWDRLSIQDGCLHWVSTEVPLNDKDEPTSWLAQWFPIGGVDAEVGVTYTLHYKIKGDHDENISALGFGQTPYGQLPITTEWVDGTFDYECTEANGNILMQAGNYVGTFDIAYLKITHEGKREKPAEWIELLTNGDAEKSWEELGLADIAFDDMENNMNVCFWSKEKGVNDHNPHPAEIVALPEGGHAFICRATLADTEGDPSAWDNQIWIQAPRTWKAGEQYKLSFRYKASEPVVTNTQVHHQKPSDYLWYIGVGDVSFTTEWQNFEQVVSVSADQSGMWSIAFNLNPNVKTPVDFYIDDISWSEMKLDHGYFIAATNTESGLVDYDYENATELVYDEDFEAYVGTVGTAGKPDTYVNEVMISTVRGNDKQFKANTIRAKAAIKDQEYIDIEEGASAKIKLPSQGVWNVYLDMDNKVVAFEWLEGDEPEDPIDIVPNENEIVIKTVDREMTLDEAVAAGLVADKETATDEEKALYSGQPWDNQFFLIGDRDLEVGEEVFVAFDYMSTTPATVGTQNSRGAGNYLHWAGLGNIEFTTEWKHFETTVKIPGETAANGPQNSWTFNLANDKNANEFHIKNIIFCTADKTETLIDMVKENENNFQMKIGANTAPVPTGIKEIKTNKVTTNAMYNLAGQRVSKDYKGIAIKNGVKYIVK